MKIEIVNISFWNGLIFSGHSGFEANFENKGAKEEWQIKLQVKLWGSTNNVKNEKQNHNKIPKLNSTHELNQEPCGILWELYLKLI